jgi:hypothetical protein
MARWLEGGRYELFTPSNQRNNSAVDTADFAVAASLVQHDWTTKDSLYLYSKNETVSW